MSLARLDDSSDIPIPLASPSEPARQRCAKFSATLYHKTISFPIFIKSRIISLLKDSVAIFNRHPADCTKFFILTMVLECGTNIL